MSRLKLAAVGLGPRAGLVETAASHPGVEIVGLCDAETGPETAPGKLVQRLARAEGETIQTARGWSAWSVTG
jgi:hypothetical protein